MMPSYYGRCWFDPCRNVTVSAPIPLNIIARGARLIWSFAKHPFPRANERLIIDRLFREIQTHERANQHLRWLFWLEGYTVNDDYTIEKRPAEEEPQ